MLLIDFLKLFKLMLLVRVSKQAAVAANWNLAGLAVVAERSIMLFTKFFLSLLRRFFLLIHHLHHIRKETTWYELIGS